MLSCSNFKAQTFSTYVQRLWYFCSCFSLFGTMADQAAVPMAVDGEGTMEGGRTVGEESTMEMVGGTEENTMGAGVGTDEVEADETLYVVPKTEEMEEPDFGGDEEVPDETMDTETAEQAEEVPEEEVIPTRTKDTEGEYREWMLHQLSDYEKKFKGILPEPLYTEQLRKYLGELQEVYNVSRIPLQSTSSKATTPKATMFGTQTKVPVKKAKQEDTPVAHVPVKEAPVKIPPPHLQSIVPATEGKPNHQ